MATKEPAPIELPAAMWTRPDVLDMCRRRDAHALLSLANSSKYRITQTQLAYWMDVETGVVNKIINGKSGPVVRLDKWESIADALRMPDPVRIVLGLAPKNYQILAAAILNSGMEYELEERPETAPPTAENSNLNRSHPGYGYTQLEEGAAVLRGFSAALGNSTQPHPADTRVSGLSEVVEDLRQTSMAHRQAYRYLSYEVLLPQALAHIDSLVSLRPGAQPTTVRNSLVSTIGEMAALVGTLTSLDMHDYQHGNVYLSMALSAAKEAGNKDLLAFTLGARAFHSAYSGRLTDGIDFAEGGITEAANGGSVTTRAWLAAVASELHASNNDDYKCRVRLDDSREILRQEDDQPWVGVGLFNDAKLRAYRGGNLNRLGRYSEAQAELTRAIELLPTTAFKHRATASIDLAESYLPSEELTEACSWAIQALALTAQTRHADSLDRIRALYRQACAIDHRARPVKTLGEQLLASS